MFIYKRIKKYFIKRFFYLKYFLMRNYLNHNDFTILSSNCLASRIYQVFNLPYNSPTIGLFFYGDDFIKFISKLDKYTNMNLKFKDISAYPEINKMRADNNLNYPIGELEDIETQFLHYNNKEEAISKWNRRCQRINKDKIFIIDTDRDGFNEDILNKYEEIIYPKIIFTAKKYDKKYTIQVKEYEDKNCVDDLYNSGYLFKYLNPLEWINNSIKNNSNL